MGKYKQVFERREKKYMLPVKILEQFTDDLCPYMEKDKYGLYTVTSIYYDTDDYRIIRSSISKPAYKEKLRLRAYGVPGNEDDVFLELKKKLGGVVYKRRISIPLGEAEAYLHTGLRPARTSQIFEEIDWFVQRHQPAPKVLLSCDRTALRGKADPEFRITFDHKVRWRDYDLDLSKGIYGESLIAPGECLMEIKTGGAIPLWLCELLSDYRIYPRSFSKYGTCYQTNLLEKGGVLIAG